MLLWAFWTKDASTVFYFAGPRLSFSPLQQIAWIGSRVAVFWWSISHICQKLVNSRVLRFLLRDSLPSCIFKASQALENVVRKGEHIVSTKYSVSNYCGASSFIISFRSHTKRDSRHSEFLLFVWDGLTSLSPSLQVSFSWTGNTPVTWIEERMHLTVVSTPVAVFLSAKYYLVSFPS